jgi:hypothetical protein
MSKNTLLLSFLARDFKKVSEIREAFLNMKKLNIENAKRYIIQHKDHDAIKETFHLLVLVLKEIGFQDYEVLTDDEIIYLYLLLRNFRKGFLAKPLHKLFLYNPELREAGFYLLFLCALKYVFVDVKIDSTFYSLVSFFDYPFAEKLLKTPEVHDIL